MENKLLESIDDLIDEIYSADQNNISDKFINFLDQLSSFISGYKESMTEMLNPILLEIQNAFISKDYTLLSDIILYKLKNSILEL